jgi:predicted MFS family arabinose efflux permease
VSLCFAHLSDPERQYGGVRLWGTVGWVAPGLALGWWLSDPAVVRWLLEWLRPYEPRGGLADSQRLAALLAFALAAYSLTLPHTPPAKRRTSWLAPLGALRLLRARPFAVFAACSVGLCVTIPFSFQLTPLLLEHLGVPRPWLSPTLTISQSMEVVSLGLLPVLLLRLGVRGTMLLGLAAWCTALAVLMAGRPTWLVIASLALNGICVCCFLVAGQVFVHGRAASDIRASAQALLTFLNGVGLLAGNLLVGVVRELAGGDFDETFAAAVALAAALVVVFLIGFTDSGPRRASAEPLTPSNHQPEA